MSPVEVAQEAIWAVEASLERGGDTSEAIYRLSELEDQLGQTNPDAQQLLSRYIKETLGPLMRDQE